MSKHRRPEAQDEDVAVVGTVEDDPATGPVGLSPLRVVVVPRQRAASEPLSGVEDAPPGEWTSPVEREWAALSPQERAWREWSDAPGGFVRPHTGPIPAPTPRPASTPPPAPLPDDAWGPWPPEPPASGVLPVLAAPAAWVPPETHGPGAWVMGGIAVLVVLLLGLGVGLVQPELLGLHAPPLFETTGEAGPGTTGGSTTLPR